MIQTILKKLDLTEKEIEVYLELLKIGLSRASVIAYKIGEPRTTVQSILLKLEEKGLVTKFLDKNTYIFSPIHPNKLVNLADEKKRQKNKEFLNLINDLEEIQPALMQIFHSDMSVPKVQVFRGEDALRKVLFDTLSSKTELLDYANIDNMFKYVKEINDEYVAEREKTNIKKRSLLLDTPFAREVYEGGQYSPKSHAGYKWIKSELYPFALEMNIYDGKVSYITYVENDFTGVIIENEHIYQMHESMWKMAWDLL